VKEAALCFGWNVSPPPPFVLRWILIGVAVLMVVLAVGATL
jgi:hypothetical protein